MSKKIKIVTAFFDIGRGDWSETNFKRTAQDYLNYFRYLAELDNEMVVFTSSDLKDEVLRIRQGKPTKIIELNFHHKFKYLIKKIDGVLKNPEYIMRVPEEIRQNPEYQSAEYVLVNNLKYYFVMSALREDPESCLFAWVDFGFCRNSKTTHGIKEWKHSFEDEFIHLFTLKESVVLESKEKMLQRAINNEVYFIGSMIVGSRKSWSHFYSLVTTVQKYYLDKNISDDDQGTMLMTYCEDPTLFKVHSLYKRGWFSSFKLFNEGSTYVSIWARLRALLDKIYTVILRRGRK